MALVTSHTKGKVVDSCLCPKVGAPKRNDCGNVTGSSHGTVVGNISSLGAGKDFKPGAKGQLQSGRGGRHGQL
jgi:hypothetical protein